MGREDRAAGNIKRVKGKMNEMMGVAKGDRSQELKGKVQGAIGKVQSKLGKSSRTSSRTARGNRARRSGA
jgi:uncharacterized protein YjbJ (UPF0337 family)